MATPGASWRELELQAARAQEDANAGLAGSLFSQAARLALETGALADSCRLFCDSVDACLGAGLGEEAAVSARSAKASLDGLEGHADWLDSASAVNDAFIAAGLIRDSVAVTAEIVAFTDAIADETPESFCLRGRSRSMHASSLMRDYQSAESHAVVDEGLRLAPFDAHTLRGNLEYTRGLSHATANEIGLAREAYSRAREQFRLGGDDFDVAYVDRVDGAALARTGQFEEAIKAFERAKAVFARLDKPREVDRCEPGIVLSQLQNGFVWSSPQLNELERTAARMYPSESVSIGLNVANISFQQGDLERANRVGNHYLQIARNLGLDVNAAKLEATLSAVTRNQGDLATAMLHNRSARDVFARKNLLRETANADINHAIQLEQEARNVEKASADPDERMTAEAATRTVALREAAAEHALTAVRVLDDLRHSLPRAADRHSLIRRVYPHVFTVAIGSCMRADRFDEAAALIERARVQPVLLDGSDTYTEPRPIAARAGATPVGGTGRVVHLADLAEQVSPGAVWLGWWLDNDRLIRSETSQAGTEVENTKADLQALARLAHCQPVELESDVAACEGNAGLVPIVALWRAASLPLVNDPPTAAALAALLPPSVASRVRSERRFVEATSMSADQLLWPIAVDLFTQRWRERMTRSHAEGRRSTIVVAPPPEFGRVPWAALPLTDPALGSVTRLIDVADIAVGLPASLWARLAETGLQRTLGGFVQADTDSIDFLGDGRTRLSDDKVRSASDEASGSPGVMISDSIGNLPWAAKLRRDGWTVLGSSAPAKATRENLAAALSKHPRLLVVNGHVSPGTDLDPASASLLLVAGDDNLDPMSVAEVRKLGVPPQCAIFGCDGAGAATGTEWTGVAVGLVWAGARQVLTTIAPVIDDAVNATLDDALLGMIESDGLAHGLWRWQRTMSERMASVPEARDAAPHRWASTVVLGADW